MVKSKQSNPNPNQPDQPASERKQIFYSIRELAQLAGCSKGLIFKKINSKELETPIVMGNQMFYRFNSIAEILEILADGVENAKKYWPENRARKRLQKPEKL